MDRKGFFKRTFAAIAAISASAASAAAENMSMVATKVDDTLSGRKDRKALDRITEARHKARWRTRRIICNNDGNDTTCAGDDVITREMFLSRRSLGLVGSHVDSIFYCTGITFGGNHKSRHNCLVQQRMGKDHMCAELEKMGTDPLALTVDFCRQHGIEVFWSHRMNDNHDIAAEELLTDFKKSHPEYLMEHKGIKGYGKSNVYDYSEQAVRDKAVECCQEILDEYDVDGIELDFFRHMWYFSSVLKGNDATEQECEMMTDVVRRIRHAMDRKSLRTGKPVLLAVRVPDSPEYARCVGIDYNKWVEEDLVDIIVAADYFKLRPWKEIALYGRKHNIPVYASMEKRRLSLMNTDGRNDALNKLWMDEAYAAWLSGMNGMYTFNLFDPQNELFRLIGDPRLLAAHGASPRESYCSKELGYTHPNLWLKNGDRFMHVPEQPHYKIPTIHQDSIWPGSKVEKKNP